MKKYFQDNFKSFLMGLYYFSVVTTLPFFIERIFPNLTFSSSGWWATYIGLLLGTGALSSIFLEKIKLMTALAAFLIPHVILYIYIAKICQEFECILLWGSFLNIIAAGGMVAAAIVTKVILGRLKKG